MQRLMVAALALTCLALLETAAPARAMLIAPQPLPLRAARAECIVVGKVTSIEEKEVEAAMAPGVPKTSYKIAVVEVSENVLGAKGQKTVRVGFVPPRAPAKPPIIKRYGLTLTVGQEGLFLLTKHPQDSFYVPGIFDFVSSQNNPKFAADLEQVKRTVKYLDDPLPGLKSKDAEERLSTANLLVERYRTVPFGTKTKTEPIDAELSKLILTAIAEANWNQNVLRGQAHPYAVFSRLGLTEQDGWSPRNFKNIQDHYAAAQAWLQKNAATYRIQRFVKDPPPAAGK
jgi:hypothetical protein